MDCTFAFQCENGNLRGATDQSISGRYNIIFSTGSNERSRITRKYKMVTPVLSIGFGDVCEANAEMKNEKVPNVNARAKVAANFFIYIETRGFWHM